ncbi:MAG: MBOAT family protein [Acetobacteraceae bacterium]
MLFSSYGFVGVFLPLTLAGFALAGRMGADAARVWLVAASLVFYGWWNVVFLPLLLASVVGNFAIARLIARLPDASAARRRVLVCGIAANLAALAWCRYLPDWLAGLNGWIDTGLRLDDPLVPLGISFFTFTQIGNLLDCAAGIEERRRFLDYLLFVSFFPALIAGPIQTSRETMAQIAERPRWSLSAEDLAVGAGLFLIGLLKKTLLADPLAGTVAAGFADPHGLGLLAAWQVALSWSMQLYFDFSGYSDMAIGLARMVGLRYPLNFNSPYKARSVIEYWQRWHMSLTRFFMASLHAPMTMAMMRRRRARGLRTDRVAQRRPAGFAAMLLLPLCATMALAGVWHGAGLTFLVFGLLHGVFLAVNHAWRLWRPRVGSSALVARMGQVALTYVCVLAGAVIFRAPTLEAAGSVLAGMAGLHGGSLPAPTFKGLEDAAVLAGLGMLVWAAPNSQQIMGMAQQSAARWQWRPSLPWAMAFGCAGTLGLLSMGGTAEFLYFRF